MYQEINSTTKSFSLILNQCMFAVQYKVVHLDSLAILKPEGKHKANFLKDKHLPKSRTETDQLTYHLSVFQIVEGSKSIHLT